MQPFALFEMKKFVLENLKMQKPVMMKEEDI
jgi:hypothetical protein